MGALAEATRAGGVYRVVSRVAEAIEELSIEH
jgi:hypothetical protein